GHRFPSSRPVGSNPASQLPPRTHHLPFPPPPGADCDFSNLERLSIIAIEPPCRPLNRSFLFKFKWQGTGLMFTFGGSQKPGVSRLDRRRRLWLVSACLASLAASPAYAQDATEEEQAAAAEAQPVAAGKAPANSEQLQEIVVTASSVATDIRKAPARDSVIDQATRDGEATAEVSAVNRNIPGL